MRKKLCIFAVLVILCINISGHALVFSSQEINTVSKIETVAVAAKVEVSPNIVDLDNTDHKLLQSVKHGPDALIINEPSPKPVQGSSSSQKEVFLTFDDGPSPNTIKILKILNDNGIKATFFVLGSSAERNPDIIKAEYNSGMTILNHSYSHNYSMYKSVEGCMADFDKSRMILTGILGVEPLTLIRFPGGSDNRVSNSNTMRTIRNTFAGKGMNYVDWNVSSEDASAAKVSAEKIRKSTISQISHKNLAVILMHDAAGKTTTVEALPAIIDYLKNQGFTFRTFKDITASEYDSMVSTRIIDRNVNK